jgi:UDP-2,3-diacylglucosamine pyrophosphatase LpxH
VDLVVISDLHLGSSYCLRDKLLKFLRELPDGPDLVLNGDVIDRWTKELSPEDEEVMTLLRDECSRRRVFWLSGNHDKRCSVECPTGDIEFAENIPVEGRLFISHGDSFDNMLLYGRPITAMLRWLYRIRLKLGCKPMHVATYGKTWPRLYNIIRLHVLHNAVTFALRKGYPAITCGHSHFAEDTVVKGVRYINTGAWTELPAYAVWVTDNEIRFEQVSS